MPKTADSGVELVEVVCPLKGVYKTCQAVASVDKKKSVNVVSASVESKKILLKIQENLLPLFVHK